MEFGKFWLILKLKLCLISRDPRWYPQGPCTYDVRTEGGEGGSRIAQFCGRIRLIGCVKCGQGGGGSKIPKILWTSYVHGPLPHFGSPPMSECKMQLHNSALGPLGANPLSLPSLPSAQTSFMIYPWKLVSCMRLDIPLAEAPFGW